MSGMFYGIRRTVTPSVADCVMLQCLQAIRAVLSTLSLAATGALLSGCASADSTLGYYLQSIRGHWAVMQNARPIDEVIQDPATASAVSAQLARVKAIRAFASRELALPDNASYTRYTQLPREFVLWNVFAAPALSLELRQWCFPVAGCIVYRGYYDEADAKRVAQALIDEGLDVQVAGVPAYSTLGWFDDPVLSSFIAYSEPQLARLVFHELAHQIVYVPGDSTFNESFATAVEEAGVKRWLASRDDARLIATDQTLSARREQFLALLTDTRARLCALYEGPGTDEEKRTGKARVFQGLGDRYRVLKAQWGGWSGYDRWFGQTDLGNAHLAAVGTYTDAVPGFERMLQALSGDLRAFYADVKRLAKLDPDDRNRRLGIGKAAQGCLPAVQAQASLQGS